MTRTLAAALVALASTATAHAGEIAMTDGAFTWTTACARPVAPFVRRGDPDGQERLMSYAAEVQTFVLCMQGEAQNDLDAAQREMHEAVQAAVQREVDNANDQMERVARESW